MMPTPLLPPCRTIITNCRNSNNTTRFLPRKWHSFSSRTPTIYSSTLLLLLRHHKHLLASSFLANSSTSCTKQPSFASSRASREFAEQAANRFGWHCCRACCRMYVGCAPWPSSIHTAHDPEPTCLPAVQWSIDSLVAARMFDHLFEDYEARQELALQWLYQEFQAIIDARLDKKKRAHDDKSTVALWLRYNALLARLLQTLQAAMEKEPEQLEPLFVETMLQAPFLPALDFDPDYEEPMALSLTDRPAPRVIEPPGADVAHLLASMCERIDSQRLLSLGFLLLKKLIRHRTASQQTYV